MTFIQSLAKREFVPSNFFKIGLNKVCNHVRFSKKLKFV